RRGFTNRDRSGGDVLLEHKAWPACAGAAAAADCGRARLYANGAPALSITAARCIEYQRAVARQSCRGSSDQKLRARTRGTRAFQSRQRSTAARHAGRDEDMGDLLAGDVDVRSNRCVARAGLW